MVTWKISAAWLTKQHDCTIAGITKRCHGACCIYFGTKCGHLGPNGCVLSKEDKPVICNLYPLRVIKNTLVMHNIATMKNMNCAGNYGNGPMLIDAIKDNLVTLFGEEEYNRIRETVLSGKDAYIDVSDEVLSDYIAETLENAEHKRYTPRTERRANEANIK